MLNKLPLLTLPTLLFATSSLVNPGTAVANPSAPRALTIVAVVDTGFSPYHYDFLGHQHPFNLDNDPSNDIDFSANPSTYIQGHPGGTKLSMTIPQTPEESVDSYRANSDAQEWSKFKRSSDASSVFVHWFEGTKIIGAVSFSGAAQGASFYGTNDAHGTRSAASAAGNIHGTCKECLFVLVNGTGNEGLKWAASQPWIDVVTNSYGASLSGGIVRDNIYFDAPIDTTRAASEDGSVIVFSAGNGLLNAFDVPMLTYWSSQKGPDWIVTVGAASPSGNQTASGSGKPVDISSIGSSYPSSGGTTANGTGTHSGTSNAAPTVAGYFAKTLQSVRAVLGDTTPGHAGGIVASGTPVPCGDANSSCVLSDGRLTRTELEQLVYEAAIPSPAKIDFPGYPTVPTTQYSYYYQGHGVYKGRMQPDENFDAEIDGILSVATGDSPAFTTRQDESNWFTVDSKCRQRLWGSWNGGVYKGVEPTLDLVNDPIATSFDSWCSQFQQNALSSLGNGG